MGFRIFAAVTAVLAIFIMVAQAHYIEPGDCHAEPSSSFRKCATCVKDTPTSSYHAWSYLYADLPGLPKYDKPFNLQTCLYNYCKAKVPLTHGRPKVGTACGIFLGNHTQWTDPSKDYAAAAKVNIPSRLLKQNTGVGKPWDQITKDCCNGGKSPTPSPTSGGKGPHPAPTPATTCKVMPYKQCGGQGYKGAKCCPVGFYCKKKDMYWSDCQKK